MESGNFSRRSTSSSAAPPAYVIQSKQSQVKNRAPAPVQITAEQILREASDRGSAESKAPVRRIHDAEELELYRQTKRKEFEDTLRRVRTNVGAWIKYAEWEQNQFEFQRARNIFERSFDVDYKNEALWMKYIEMEQKNKFPNHARNLFDRVVQLLPRCDKFWYKYIHMEEMLGNVDNARIIFERWLKWEPSADSWISYIHMEVRHRNFQNARTLYERMIFSHPYVSTYLQFAAFEGRQQGAEGQANARAIFERCPVELGIENMDASYFLKFAAFEEKNKELERARIIYQKGLLLIPKHLAEDLYRKFIAFEKQYGDKDGIENVILQKRRIHYEKEVSENPLNYDVWFDYARLEESNGNVDKIREVYERAIANIPLAVIKDAWRRYIYLWINYALFEELIAQDITRTGIVYEECLKVIPHGFFTFGKIWIMNAHYLIRNGNLDKARKLLGTAIGKHPKKSVFKAYIELEQTLGEIDRCRKLYEKMLEVFPDSCYAWIHYATLESNVEEIERARALYELAVSQELQDDPDALWKSYIEFEFEHKEYGLVRKLYDRLLDKSKHVKVWISRAQFQAKIDALAAREMFKQADIYFRDSIESAVSVVEGDTTAVVSKEERLILLEAWRDFEAKHGDTVSLQSVVEKLPKRIKKKRMLKNADGTDAGWEEFYDYIFPDETKSQANLKLLENVKKWKKQKQTEKVEAVPQNIDG